MEYSDIGYYQEELTCRSDIPGTMDLGNEISQWNCHLVTSAESKMNGLLHHEEDGKRKPTASETPISAPSGKKSFENLVSTCKCYHAYIIYILITRIQSSNKFWLFIFTSDEKNKMAAKTSLPCASGERLVMIRLLLFTRTHT